MITAVADRSLEIFGIQFREMLRKIEQGDHQSESMPHVFGFR
jgi:hypothetical protein